MALSHSEHAAGGALLTSSLSRFSFLLQRQFFRFCESVVLNPSPWRTCASPLWQGPELHS